MRTDERYQPQRAKAIIFALVDGRRVRIAGATLDDVMALLAKLCPGGRPAELANIPGAVPGRY